MRTLFSVLGLVIVFGALILRRGQPDRIQAYLGDNSEEVE